MVAQSALVKKDCNRAVAGCGLEKSGAEQRGSAAGKRIHAAIMIAARNASSARRKVVAVIENVGRQIEVNGIISGENGVVVILVTGLATEHHLAVVVAQAK